MDTTTARLIANTNIALGLAPKPARRGFFARLFNR